MQLFYNPRLDISQPDIRFDKDESRHISRVLRKHTGDSLLVTNGQGLLANVKLTSVEQKSCAGSIQDIEERPPLPYHLHMGVAPTKSNDRFEWFIEKATEIGISKITPLICTHSERKSIKLDRLQRVAVAAMKQSQRVWLPAIQPAMGIDDFLKADQKETFLAIAHCQEGTMAQLKTELAPGTSSCILIGPEGDFSNEEVTLALKKGYLPVSLGKHRLRTETAALAACHSVAFINE